MKRKWYMRVGSVLEVVNELPENAFDACLCDPPYGLKFMGKKWDYELPSIETWKAIRRTMKPGAYLLAFGGTRTHHRLWCAIEDAGFEIRDCIMWLYGSGMPKSKHALKPAHEPICVARVPSSRSIRENLERYGCGGMNIEGCRIGTGEDRAEGGLTGKRISHKEGYGGSWRESESGRQRPTGGRWPANVCLDESAASVLDEQSGKSKSPKPYEYGGKKSGGYTGSGIGRGIGHDKEFGDSGGASRFFYCPKASERERTCSGKVENKHPTVKPLALDKYLSRLIQPPKGKARRLLVPFAGTGSEVIGALAEGWERVFGIEIDETTARTAKKRIRYFVRRIKC